MEGGIETADKFSLIFPIEKGEESGSINFSHHKSGVFQPFHTDAHYTQQLHNWE
jgi:hypothetical protein